jgi:hypothetical protein
MTFVTSSAVGSGSASPSELAAAPVVAPGAPSVSDSNAAARVSNTIVASWSSAGVEPASGSA